MKKIIWFASLLVGVMLVLAACTRPDTMPLDTTPPVVNIATPADGATVTIGTAVSVAGTATDAGGIASVAVLANGSEVNTVVPSTDDNWSLEWLPESVGDYELSAKATDKAGNSTTSDVITVTVTELPATSGSVSGTITRTSPVLETPSVTSAAAVEQVPVVPGELFVVFKPGIRDVTLGTTGSSSVGAFSFAADGSFTFGGNRFTQLTSYRRMGGLGLYRSSGLSEVGTRDLVDRLRASDVVAEAFPNWILSITAMPNDPIYPLQWHYQQLNLEAAWDVETGASNKVTVAVLDTGRFDHPDVQWAAGGANFANWDGTEPSAGEGPIDDPHTNPGGSTHGTHVAGTIGAVTDNEEGVAGVNWNVDVLPVKVLDENGSGSFAGILEGIWWAAGGDDESYAGYVNESPAQVINMSLGGAVFEACPSEIDGLFEALASEGTYTVVAAGNEGSPSDIFFPANCPNVITVGATGPTGERAYYSNYGPFIDVMAPGGDDEYPDPSGEEVLPYAAIVSTVSDGTTPSYGFMEGTSMAAPHVAGVVSLMLAQEPTLTFEQVRERLHDASAPLTLGECNVPALGFDGLNVCGAGLLDAEAALLGTVLTTSTAYAYALPYVGGAPPAVNYGDLPSLELMARYRVEATAVGDGDFSYALEDLAPGTYEVIGLELRDASAGISTIDRIGVVLDVEVVAGEVADELIVVTPMYLLPPVAAVPAP